MLDGYCVACRRCLGLHCLSSFGCIPLTVIYLLTFLTLLQAAAVNRTAHTANQILPADHLQPAVEQDAQEVKVEQVNSLNIDCHVNSAVHY